MRDLAIDLEILGEHVVLLGNQVIRINLKVLAKLHSFSMHREWVKIR
jgi:hypothetical protein